MTTGKNTVKIIHEFNSNNGSNGFKGSMKVGKRAGGLAVPSGQRPGPASFSFGKSKGPSGGIGGLRKGKGAIGRRTGLR